jgi:hypothetical protein
VLWTFTPVLARPTINVKSSGLVTGLARKECMKSCAAACGAISLSGLIGSMQYARDAGDPALLMHSLIPPDQARMSTLARTTTLVFVYRHDIQNQCKANHHFIGGQTTPLTAPHVLQGDLLLRAIGAQQGSRFFGSRGSRWACSFTIQRMATQSDVGCGMLSISCTTYDAMSKAGTAAM